MDRSGDCCVWNQLGLVQGYSYNVGSNGVWIRIEASVTDIDTLWSCFRSTDLQLYRCIYEASILRPIECVQDVCFLPFNCSREESQDLFLFDNIV